MRADRSLIPGLGAAASMVAAVACAFFITAAIVGFHQGLQVAPTSSARALVVAADSRHARAIVVHPAPARTRPAVATHATPAAPVVSAHVVAVARPRRVTAVTTPKVVPPAGTTTTTPPPAVTPTVKQPDPNSLAATTQTTATNVSGLVNGLTNGVATAVTPVSPALASTVQSLGASVSSAVITIGNNLAELVLGLGPTQ